MPRGILQDWRYLSELNRIRYRSSTGLLNVSAVDHEAFGLLFRFQKDDFDSFWCLLGVPHVVTCALGIRVAGAQAMCMALRRLAYPNRWFDLEPMFEVHSSLMSSVTAELMTHIVRHFGHLLRDLNNQEWLSEEALDDFSAASHRIFGVLKIKY
ncbi:hypothetical protein MRX96_017788 [Rhipicephalus microplus]